MTPRFCLSLSQFVQHFKSWYFFWKRNNGAFICHLDCDDRLRNKHFIGLIKLINFSVWENGGCVSTTTLRKWLNSTLQCGVTPRFCLSLSQFVQHFRSWYLLWKRNNRAITCYLNCDDRLRNKNFIGHIKMNKFFCLSVPALLYPSLHFGMPFTQYLTYKGPQHLILKRRGVGTCWGKGI